MKSCIGTASQEYTELSNLYICVLCSFIEDFCLAMLDVVVDVRFYFESTNIQQTQK